MALVLFGEIHDLRALESELFKQPGLKSLRLLTDVSAIVPGDTITVGILLDPLPDHHTYWRGPGIVGVATRMDWTLPEGFTAGELIWPPPSQVTMAGILAQGYKTPALLLTEISTPIALEEKDVTISVRCSWMACSTSCHPGVADLGFTIPVVETVGRVKRDKQIAKQFAEVRRITPKPAPADWTFTPRLPAPDRIEIDLVIPGFDPSRAPTLRFYCHDMQVDSDEPQTFTVIDPAKGALRLGLARPEFAPRDPGLISGVLHCPGGWPGLDTEHIEFSAPWPEGTFPNE